jgi:3-oxoacyl-[acyl-carrier protein] reductase
LGGGIDILVNNAGIYGPMGPIEEIDYDQFVSTVQVNLFGTVMMCREVIPIMRRQNGGKIINLSGGGGATPLPRIDAYAASKAAVVRLTENLAMELADTGIDVNAIAPGALNTKMLDQVLEAGAQKVGRDFYERALRQRDEGGAGLDKGAAVAVFLASADSDGISGRLISAVWDDWSNLQAHRQELADSDIFTLRRIVPKDRGQAW